MIINSLLDTDYYKITMSAVVLHKYPATMVRYAFKCRNNINLVKYEDEIRSEILHLCTLRFDSDELSYLRNIKYLKPDYIEYLRLLQLNPNYVNVYTKNGELVIDIEGPWISTIWFEVPILAIVSEVWGKYNSDEAEGLRRLNRKIFWLSNKIHDKEYPSSGRGFRAACFSTRRRHSFAWQRYHVVPALKSGLRTNFVGTSNVLIAKELGLTPIGTMAHEYIMGHQQLGFRLKDSQKAAFQVWADEYRGHLGIALTDTVGMKAFMKDFDLYFAKLFDGARQDSGDPYQWGYDWIKLLSDLGVDPKTKSGIFSDGLTFEKALDLHHTFKDRFRPSFGIGTFLSNDMGNENPNIVIKMVECNGEPVAKISDSSGKGMCEDEDYLRNLKKVYNIGETK